MFTSFNRDLAAWGYLENPRLDFPQKIRMECSQLSSDPILLKSWAERMEAWIVEGDRILQNIEGALCSDMIVCGVLGQQDTICHRIFRVLCRATLTIQYMTVVVEFTLDKLGITNLE